MRIRYLGEYAREKRSYGCSRCGTGSYHGGYETFKTRDRHYYNGRLLIFNQGEIVDVDDMLGNFLLRRTYWDKNGIQRHAYEKVISKHEETWVEGYHIDPRTEVGELPPEKPKPPRDRVTKPDAVRRTIEANDGDVRVEV